MSKKPEFPFPHVVDHQGQRVWVRASYPTGMAVPLYIDRFYKGCSWYLASEEMFESLKEQFHND